MAKKKPDEVKKGLAEWMGTYGDLVTLLLTFFVLLYAMSNIDVVKFQMVAASMSSSASIVAVGGSEGINDLLGSGIMEMPNTDKSVNDSKEKYEKSKKELKKMSSDFKTYFAQNEVSDKISMDVTDEYIKLSFADGLLFDAGKASLKEAVYPVLSSIADELSNYPNSDIRIEGHTDNDPINSPQYPSNWYLSAARAISVGDYFISEKQLNPARITAEGMGEYKPIAPNDTPENKAKNRRVEIKIFSTDFSSGVVEAKEDTPIGYTDQSNPDLATEETTITIDDTLQE